MTEYTKQDLVDLLNACQSVNELDSVLLIGFLLVMFVGSIAAYIIVYRNH